MVPKTVLEIVDKTYGDFYKTEDIPFAGKWIILGCDFRQILPVSKTGFRISLVQESVKYSYLKPDIMIMYLKKLYHVIQIFLIFFLKTGEGSIELFHIPDN